MFYLLEDNRIIDSNNKEDIELLRRDRRIIENEKIVYYSVNFLKNKQCMNCSHWNCIKCQYAKKFDEQIKNQSENVFDLIEVGDLIKFYKYIGGARTEKTITSQVCYNFEGSTFTYGGSTFHCDILAIYKPNEKGDYIKVWEKKDE